MTTTPSKACYDIIKKWETLSLKAFKPTPYDVWTIGWGRTEGVHQGMECTPEEAETWLRDHVERTGRSLARTLTVPLSPPEFDAITSLVYNVGLDAFLRSKALHLLNAGDKAGFIDQAFGPEHGFVYQQGHFLQGLANRRLGEQRLFSAG